MSDPLTVRDMRMRLEHGEASASDAVATLAAVAVTLAVVALSASVVPAVRALRLDPVKVLRAD